MIQLKREWLGALALLAAFAVPAHAQTAPPPEPADGRFSMTPVANGFLRLDTRTGQTSLCTVSGALAQCRASAEEPAAAERMRAALEAEIARLTRENAELKGRTPAASVPVPTVPAPATAQAEEDRRFDHAMDRAETFMRRMLRLFRDYQDKPVLEKPDLDKPASPSL